MPFSSDQRLKEIFAEAYDLMEPFFDPANAWSGHGHEHLAYMALHERFPDLAPDQLTVLVSAMKKLYSNSSTPPDRH